MPAQRIAPLALCAFALLLYCNSNKTNSHNAAAISSTTADTIFAVSESGIPLPDFSNDFLQNSTQFFTAAPHKITVVQGVKGLKVTINPGVLEKEDGSAIDENISVKLIELTTSEDLFKCNAATVSNGKLLMSGGSYFIGMECGGQKLHIAKGKSLQVNFPQLKKDEMELFYGNRDGSGNMNWTKMNKSLTAETEVMPAAPDISFSESPESYNDIPAFFSDSKTHEPKVYKTLNEEVYYYNTKMSIRELIDTINHYTVKVYIDTVHPWPKITTPLPEGARIDSNYLNTVYGPYSQFIIRSYRALQAEKEETQRRNKLRDSVIANWQAKSLAGQLQKYYTPSNITDLGWINCDRFYNQPQDSNVPIEIPYTINSSQLHYFLIYRSFNGLISGQLNMTDDGDFVLTNLPRNQNVTLIAFTKSNGKIYQCKEDFVINKNKPIKPEFNEISVDEMKKMFGKNVRI